jgi:putative DNA primase/helicase
MTPHDVIGQMLAAGLEAPPNALNLHGRLVRFGPKKNQWYRLVEHRTGGGQYVVTGSFGTWVGQQKWRVDVDWKGINDEERAQLAARRAADAQAEAAKRQQEAARAAMTAAELWRQGERTGTSAYLQRKGVDAEACRYLPDGSILVPLLRYDMPRDQALRAVQRIFADGQKRFTKGFEKPRACLRLGLVAVGEPLLVCEGYATGLTLRMAVERRLPVFVALDAGNLLPVAEMLRELHPDNRILVCADDDARTQGNPGRDKAHKLSKAVPDCSYTWPIFRRCNRGPKDTDFNDLHIREGLHVVRRQLRHVLPMLGSEILNAA